MKPAFSVILLTTLIGAGQGLFLALYASEVWLMSDMAGEAQARAFFASGSALALALLALGLIASFFHLGHPERAWRAAAMWRTSWLSREVIVLPAFMAAVLAYGLAHHLGFGGTIAAGAAGGALCLALFLCTAMIYASLKFLQEWATPLTPINYTLLGCASGCTLAAALAAATGADAAPALARGAIALTFAGFVARSASLVRNARLKRRSNLQSAIGVKHPCIAQKAQGFMGGSFNTREFFHGRTPGTLRAVKWIFMIFAFAVPVALLALGLHIAAGAAYAAAFVCQYAGLIAERWYFFAQADHPQNLYYRVMS